MYYPTLYPPVLTPIDEALPGEGRCKCVLLAEDDNAMRALLRATLEEQGYEVLECADGLGLTRALGNWIVHDAPLPFSLIVSDIRMPWLTGLQALKAIRSCNYTPPMILITAFGDEDTHSEARMLGAAAVLDKPFCLDAFVAIVDEVLRDKT